MDQAYLGIRGQNLAARIKALHRPADTTEMQECPSCHESVSPQAVSCPSCGQEIAAIPFLSGTDDPWGAAPDALPVAPSLPPPLPPTASDVSRASLPQAKTRFPTWAKVLIGVVALVVVLGSVAGFLVFRAFRDMDVSDLEALAGDTGSTFLSADGAMDGTVVGDCISGALVVACTTPHDFEVFHIVNAPSEYPTFDTLFEISSQACVEAFETYVGIDYFESEFFLDAFAPSAEAWDAGDQAIRCAAYDPFGELTASVRGAAS